VILSSKAGSVAGKVINAGTGGPVIGAKVTVGSSSTSTDSEGNFFFQLVEPGTYRIIYRAPGNIQVQENISVEEGKTTVPPNVLVPVFPQVHYGSREKKKIAITVDDGFRRDYELVNLLESQSIKATAFIVGEAAQRHPEFVRYLASLDWEIANHTHTHSNPLEQSSEQIVNELQSAQRVISSITHRQSPFARSPRGNGDPRVIGAINGAGYTAAFWSLDLLDTRKNVSFETQVSEVLNKAQNGDILVCHFGGNNTARALSIIIPELKKRGFEFVTLSELFE
jgi:peptidoglycan/xylan/chitin deacetylase (PgdA/CDA1 family)